MIISIIIPTYNEEEYLPVLLDSIKKQSYTDYEIIVADANSTDRTREIAEEYGCVVVDGGLPAVGRNNGAKVAKGEYLIFLDSDLELTDDYIRNALYEFRMERAGIAITQMLPMSQKVEDKLYHDFANYFMVRVEKIEWLTRYNFPYDEIHLVKYGTTKANCTRKLGGYQILVDDNEKVRKGWNLGKTIDANDNILKELEKLINF